MSPLRYAARATSAIADAGVVQVFDFGYHVDGTAYIVMELLEGEALSARMQRGGLTLSETAHISTQIGKALDRGVERDTKGRHRLDRSPSDVVIVR